MTTAGQGNSQGNAQGIAAEKAALRSLIRHSRAARAEADREHATGGLAARALPLIADCEFIACYASTASEPGTAALIDLALQRGIRVQLPRVNGELLDWVEVDDTTNLATGAFGIPEPVGPAMNDALDQCDAVTLPALAISRGGIRLGQGGGFYDRALAELPTRELGGPARIALVFDDELRDDVPSEEHDAHVDYVVTPERVVTF